MFSSKSFIVSGLTFRSLIHFQFIFVYGARKCSFLFFLNGIYLFIKSYLFIYFWVHWVFVSVRRLSLVAENGGYSSLQCVGFSLRWLLLLWSMGSRCTDFSSCSTQVQQLWLAGSRAQTQQLWCTGLVAPRHVGSSWTRARTCVPCIGRQIRTTVQPGNSWKCSNFILLHVAVQFSQHHLLKRLSSLYTLAYFIKDKVTICAWVYLWTFYPVPLIYISVFVPLPYCLDYCSFSIV